MAATLNQPGTVVSFPARAGQPAGPARSRTEIQALAAIDALCDEPGRHIVLAPELRQALPALLDEARRRLEPGDPVEVHRCLCLLAERHGLPLPQGDAYEFDLEAMSQWPRDLFRKAFLGIWECHAWRRLPTAGDFRRHIERDLEERRANLARIETVLCKLEAEDRRHRWDEAARRRREEEARRERTRHHRRVVSSLIEAPGLSDHALAEALAGTLPQEVRRLLLEEAAAAEAEGATDAARRIRALGDRIDALGQSAA